MSRPTLIAVATVAMITAVAFYVTDCVAPETLQHYNITVPALGDWG